MRTGIRRSHEPLLARPRLTHPPRRPPPLTARLPRVGGSRSGFHRRKVTGRLVYGEPRRRCLFGVVHPRSLLLSTVPRRSQLKSLVTIEDVVAATVEVITRPSPDGAPVSASALTVAAASESLPLTPYVLLARRSLHLMVVLPMRRSVLRCILRKFTPRERL
jgi:hypothetical protein